MVIKQIEHEVLTKKRKIKLLERREKSNGRGKRRKKDKEKERKRSKKQWITGIWSTIEISEKRVKTWQKQRKWMNVVLKGASEVRNN